MRKPSFRTTFLGEKVPRTFLPISGSSVIPAALDTSPSRQELLPGHNRTVKSHHENGTNLTAVPWVKTIVRTYSSVKRELIKCL